MMIFTTTLLIPNILLINAVAPNATTMPRKPSTSGTPAATAAPKTNTRTISAAGMPIISPRFRSFSAVVFQSCMIEPSPAVTALNPSRSMSSSTVSRGRTLSGASWMSPFNVTGRIAVSRSADARLSSPVS